ncbi:hypothetical protein ACWEKT_08940 [Nocardia takedensis]
MATPENEQPAAHTAIVGTTAVVIVLPRSTYIAPSDAPATADAWTSALLDNGAQPLRGNDFPGNPTPGWTVTIGPGVTTVRITGPAALGDLYEGELPAETSWRDRVAGMHHLGMGLVVISGTADSPTMDGVLEMMKAERAVWVRARTALG